MPALRIGFFDEWQPGYGLATVTVYRAGTSTPASIYTDEGLTVAAANPQTLLEKTDNGISYGKWAMPLYTGQAVELLMNSVDRTGILRPSLTTLDDQDASNATVVRTGGSGADSLADRFARSVDVLDFGDFKAVGLGGASSSTNNATLVAAIGAASAMGGGYVNLPGGTYQFTLLSLPQNVVLRGRGRGATILQNTQSVPTITVSGTRAGLSRLTLDGVSLVGSATGVYAINQDDVVLDDVEIKRFGLGLWCKGGTRHNWRNLFISNCVTGAKLHGDSSNSGSAFEFMRWLGGKVDTCSTVGVELKNVDRACDHNVIDGVTFDTNTGIALQINGARDTRLANCHWTGNTNDLTVLDGSPATSDNTVIGLRALGGAISGGAISLAGTLQDVSFEDINFTGAVAITLTTPLNNVLALDCREDSTVSIAGTSTAWIRHKRQYRGASFGLTTGNAETKAWGMELAAGQRVYLEAKVVGRQRNGVNDGFYHIAVSAHRPGATLNYDTQTANFTVGDVLTGATSGATARITADSDSGASGALTLQDVVGTFVDNEALSDPGGGAALVNGSLSLSDVALVGSVTSIRAAQETNANWDATFVANGSEVELHVTGDTAQTVEWTVDCDVVG